MDRSRTEGEKFSTLRWWSVAANRCESFKQVDGQIKNPRRHCFYFAMMIRCWKQMWVLQTNWWTDQEPKEKLFVLCDDDLLLLMDLRPSRTFRDRSRTEGETVYNFWWSTVATDRCASFKQIDGQVMNRRRNCLYFAMMIYCCWWISVLQGHLGTGREPKEKMLLLCDDDLLLLMDLRPSRTFRDRSRRQGATDTTSGWWSIYHCEYAVQHSHQCTQQWWNESYPRGYIFKLILTKAKINCPCLVTYANWFLPLADLIGAAWDAPPRAKLLQNGMLLPALGFACFPEFVQNFSEHQILWSLCLLVFHALTLRLPIQTSLSLRSHEKSPNFRKRAHPREVGTPSLGKWWIRHWLHVIFVWILNIYLFNY